jgi:hypothetical protein
MADRKFYPDDWSEYCRLRKESGQNIEPAWAQFAARYRAAQAFQSVFFMQLSEKATIGYSVGMHLLLSYTAFELGCTASGANPNKRVVLIFAREEEKALKNIRRMYGFESESYTLCKRNLTSSQLLDSINEFITGKHNNLQPICAAVRHLIAHGYWTPTGSNTLKAAARDAIENMTRSLLYASDQILHNHVETLY